MADFDEGEPPEKEEEKKEEPKAEVEKPVADD